MTLFIPEFTFWQWISLAAVLFLPGAALWSLLTVHAPRPLDKPWWENWSSAACALADVAALSIAITALLGLLGFVLNWHWRSTTLLFFYGLCAALVLALGLLRLRQLARARPTPRQSAGWLAILTLLALMILWRYLQARALVLPLWVDSTHHALIARVIAEAGGIPDTLDPYLPVPFYYHYAFHLLTALFVDLSGIGAPQAVLWVGQTLIGLAGLVVFRLAWALRSEDEGAEAAARAGLAALLTAFVFQIPAYYLTWGRYTLMAGLLVAAVLLARLIELHRAPRVDVRRVVLAVLLMGGLFLTHYLAALIVGLYAGILVLDALVAFARHRTRVHALRLLRIPLVGGMGLLITSSWLWRVWIFTAYRSTIRMITPLDGTSLATTTPAYWNYLLYLLGPRHNHILFGVAALGLILALRRRGMRHFVAWALLLCFLSQPWSLRLGPFRPDLFAIVLFLPAAIALADVLAGGAWSFKRLSIAWLGKFILTALTLLLILWGVRETYTVVNASTVLATPADVAALEWIDQNTPPDAHFLINETTWQSTFRGVDGGFWILPYTGRSTLPPPVIFSWGAPEMIAQTQDWSTRAQKIERCDQSFWDFVRETKLTHIYLRVGVGSLQPGNFTDCPRILPVYESGGVTILQILTP